MALGPVVVVEDPSLLFISSSGMIATDPKPEMAIGCFNLRRWSCSLRKRSALMWLTGITAPDAADVDIAEDDDDDDNAAPVVDAVDDDCKDEEGTPIKALGAGGTM